MHLNEKHLSPSFQFLRIVTCKLRILHVIIIPGGWNWEICPGGWIRLVWTADPGGEIPSKSQIRLLEQMLKLLDFRQDNAIFVISISTISMCQNCSISFLVDPGGGKKKLSHLAHPRYNYDVQSTLLIPIRGYATNSSWRIRSHMNPEAIPIQVKDT